MRTILAAVAAVAVAWSASTAAAAPPAAGLLTRVPGGLGCFTPAITPECTQLVALTDASRIVVAPDGKTIYTQGRSTQIVAAISRNPATGQVGSLRNCYSSGSFGGCTTVSSLINASDIAIEPGGRKVFVTAAKPAGGGALLQFPVLSDGALGAVDRCFGQSDGAAGECPAGTAVHADGLEGPTSVNVAPDGKTVYTTAQGDKGGLAAFSLDTSTGGLGVQVLPCITNIGGVGDLQCSVTDAVVADAQDTQVVPAGNRLVMTGSAYGDGAIAVYGRDTTIGGLQSRLGCFVDNSGTGPLCLDSAGMTAASALTLDSAGTGAWVAGVSEVAAFALANSPVLTTRGCLTPAGSPSDGCTETTGLDGVNSVRVDPSGNHLYALTTDGSSTGGLITLPLAANRTVIPPALQCFAQATAGACVGFASLRGASDMTFAPSGAQAYVVGDGGAGGAGGLSSFQREVGPACAGGTASTTSGTAVTVPGGCTDPNTDPLTLEITGAPANGTASVDGGSLVYTPGATFTGTDTISYRATDGTIASGTATATVTVTAPPTPTPTASPGPSPTATPTPGPGTTDAKPAARITTKGSARARTLRRLAGRATDDRGVRRVQVAVVRLLGGATATTAAARCSAMRADGRFTAGKVKSKRCLTKRWLSAKGTTTWSLTLRRRLAPGTYAVFARATDSAGQTSAVKRLRLTVRR